MVFTFDELRVLVDARIILERKAADANDYDQQTPQHRVMALGRFAQQAKLAEEAIFDTLNVAESYLNVGLPKGVLILDRKQEDVPA